jgi:hypothetical protein
MIVAAAELSRFLEERAHARHAARQDAGGEEWQMSIKASASSGIGGDTREAYCWRSHASEEAASSDATAAKIKKDSSEYRNKSDMHMSNAYFTSIAGRSSAFEGEASGACTMQKDGTNRLKQRNEIN